MKKKIGTVIDEELFLRAKRMAFLQGQAFSRLVEQALEQYLNEKEEEQGALGQKKNISQETKGVMRISSADLKAVMEEEGVYETG